MRKQLAKGRGKAKPGTVKDTAPGIEKGTARKGQPKKPSPSATRVLKSDAAVTLFDRVKSTPGGGLSHDFIDNAFWQKLPPTSVDWLWINALDQLDRLGNKQPLLHLLTSNCERSPKVGTYLADLIVRGVRPSKKHPHRPAYAPFSQDDALLMIACESVRAYVQRRMPVEAALYKVANETGLAITALANAYEGSRTSMRKSSKRL